MGNSTQANQSKMQLSSISSAAEDYYEEYYELRDCCGYKYKKSVKCLLVWEKNYICNCEDLKKIYPWSDIISQYIQEKKIPRLKFIREFNDIKYQQQEANIVSKENIMTPAEIQVFKDNLKKSVLVSYAPPKNNPSDQKPTSSMTIPVPCGKKKKQNYLQQFNRFTIVKDNARASLRSSMKSFVDDTMSNLFRNQTDQISKSGAHSLQVFVKLTMLLQKHLNNPQNKLYHIIQLFYNYIYENYSLSKQVTSKKMDELIKQIKIFLVLLRNAVEDFYNTKAFLDLDQKCNFLVSNSENILTTVTTIVFKDTKFYNFIYILASSLNKQKKDHFYRVLKSFSHKQPQQFQINPEYCLNALTVKKYVDAMSVQSAIQNLQPEELQSNQQQPYLKCVDALRHITKAKTPITKMKVIMQCSQKITESITDFYENNNMNVTEKMLDADQVLSIFCYIIASAKIQDLHTHLYILQHFATDHQMISATGYYYSVMQGAIEQLENTYDLQSTH